MDEPLRSRYTECREQKGPERYIFRYEEGNESGLLDALVASANDARVDFNCFDAAMLSFKLTQSLTGEADPILDDEFPEIITQMREDTRMEKQT
jgi:hypothetical protein